MKTKTVLFMGITLFLLIAGVGCKEEPNVTDIYITWKFQGFGNTIDNSFEKEKPDCSVDNCYILTFSKDGNFFGNTSSNGISGNCIVDGKKITLSNLFGTEIAEQGSGYRYVNALPLIESFEITKNKLKLYYNQGKEFLLFNLLN